MFMDLEKRFDRVNRNALWKTLQIYDIGVKVSESVKGKEERKKGSGSL